MNGTDPDLTIDLIMIVGKYFQTAQDFINLMKVRRCYKVLVEMYKYNPISDATLFKNIQTQHIYTEEDDNNRIDGMFRYVIHREVDQFTFFNRKDNEVYKNVTLINYNNQYEQYDEDDEDDEDEQDEQDEQDDEDYEDDEDEIDPPIEINDGLCIVPEGITKLGKHCFDSCHLTRIILPTSLKKIDDYAFRGTKIKEITIPEGVTEIGESVFIFCWDLRKVNLPSTLKIIGDWCFFSIYLPTLIVPDSVISAGGDSFHDVDHLILPDHLRNRYFN